MSAGWQEAWEAIFDRESIVVTQVAQEGGELVMECPCNQMFTAHHLYQPLFYACLAAKLIRAGNFTYAYTVCIRYARIPLCNQS